MASITYSGLADTTADGIVSGIKRVEGLVTASTGRVAGLAGRVAVVSTPRVLSRLGESPRFGFVRRLPSARELAASNFAVLERVLGAQKEYTLHVLAAAAREPKPAVKRTARPAATTAPTAAKTPRTRKAAKPAAR